MGGIAELTMPSAENRISDFGEAAQASAMPRRRFLATRRARLVAGVSGGSGLVAFDTRPSAAGRHHPGVSVHVEPFTERTILQWFGAEPEHVAVQILDLHLVRPGIVRRRVTHARPPGAELLEQRFDVADTDPDPGPRVALISFAQ